MIANSSISPVIAVTGLAFEARIARGPGVAVVCAADRATLVASLNAKMAEGVRGLVSFGTAGGLSQGLETGAWVVATAVLAKEQRFATDHAWSRNLLRLLPGAVAADIAGVDAPLATPLAKERLNEQTGAAAVDMESHVAAEFAELHGLPFAACRVVLDPADTALPSAALLALRRDGTADLAALLVALLRSPQELPALLRLALRANTARRSLVRGRRLLGAGLAFPDLGLL